MKEAVLNFDPLKGVQEYADTIVVLLEVEGDPHYEVEVDGWRKSLFQIILENMRNAKDKKLFAKVLKALLANG